MTGPLTWKDSTALPERSTVDYIVCTDSFADGGTTKWASIDTLKTSLGLGSNAYTSTAYLPLSGGSMTTTAQILCYTNSKGSSDTYNGGIQLREATGSTTSCTDNMYDAPGITFHWAGCWVHKLNMHSNALYWDNTAISLDGHTHSYLPLSGGSLTNSSNTDILNLDGSAGSEVGIRFLRSGNVRGWVGYMDGGYMYMYNTQRGNYLKYNDDGTLTFENYTVWHAGNDGSGSGLDADTIDGYHAGV